MQRLIRYYVLQTGRKELAVKEFEPRLDMSTQVTEDQVPLQVRDNGRDFPAKEASQLFNPFFTTKPTAKGMGLGLYMSKEVVYTISRLVRLMLTQSAGG